MVPEIDNWLEFWNMSNRNESRYLNNNLNKLLRGEVKVYGEKEGEHIVTLWNEVVLLLVKW